MYRKADAALDRLTKQYERELLRAYSLSLKEIRSDIATAYAKYGADFTNYTKYGRLAKLESEISKEIAKISGKSAATLRRGLAEGYAESFYRTGFILEKSAEAKLGFGLLNPDVIKRAIENPLDRVGMLQRNRQNHARLAQQLKEELTRGLVQGKSFQDTARAIKNRMDTGATNVIRIVQTEQHRVQQQGRMDSFLHAEDAGVQMKKQWVSTLDDRTRDSHQDLDGQKVDLDEEFSVHGNTAMLPGGFGVPEEDINCRCTHIGVIEGYEPKVRRAREVEGRVGEIRSYTTYNQWKEGRIKS